MSDLGIQRAVKMLSDELAKIESEIQEFETALAPRRKTAAGLRNAIAALKGERTVSSLKSGVRRGALGDGIAQILRGAGRAMTKREIAAALDGMGIPYTHNSLDSGLRKDHKQRFKRVGRGTFTLREDAEEQGSLLAEVS